MNESVIIIASIAIVIFAGGYFLYKAVEYLYELYVENFTTDTDPENPDVEHAPNISTDTFKAQMSDIILDLIWTISSVFKDFRKVLSSIAKDIRGLFAIDRDYPVSPKEFPRQTRSPNRSRYTYHRDGEHPEMRDSVLDRRKEALGITTPEETSKVWTSHINDMNDRLGRRCMKCLKGIHRPAQSGKIICDHCGYVRDRYNKLRHLQK